MKKFIADVTVEKMVTEDNWEHGVTGDYTTVYYDSFFVEFNDMQDLKHQLAKWVSERFAIDEKDFIDYVTNDIEDNRFDYSQNEDADGNYKMLTKDDPDGYLCDYIFYIQHVLQKVDYKFS